MASRCRYMQCNKTDARFLWYGQDRLIEVAFLNVGVCMQSYLEKKITVSEETVECWLHEHQLAMFVFDIEDLVEDVCSYYHQIDRHVKKYTDAVINGQIDYDFDQNQKMRGLCRRWLSLAQSIVVLPKLCDAKGYAVDAEEKLRECIKEAAKSQANDFELYAMQKANEITIPRDFLATSGSLETWPAY